MSVNSKFKDITPADFLALADRFGIGSAPKVIKQVRQVLGQWPRYAQEVAVSQRETDRIAQNHQTTR